MKKMIQEFKDMMRVGRLLPILVIGIDDLIIAIIIIVVAVAASVATSLLIQPAAQNREPPELEDIQAPTAEEGREIPVLFGTRNIKGANVVWYGDFESIAVRRRSP
jgi:hypothetical protein